MYQVDVTRLLLLLILLGAGMLVARVLAGNNPLPAAASARRWAFRGMFGMTLLGMLCGFAGGMAQSASEQSWGVRTLYTVYRVCWAPAYAMRSLQNALSLRGLDVFSGEVPQLLGLALIPVFWFLVFLALGWAHRR